MGTRLKWLPTNDRTWWRSCSTWDSSNEQPYHGPKALLACSCCLFTLSLRCFLYQSSCTSLISTWCVLLVWHLAYLHTSMWQNWTNSSKTSRRCKWLNWTISLTHAPFQPSLASFFLFISFFPSVTPNSFSRTCLKLLWQLGKQNEVWQVFSSNSYKKCSERWVDVREQHY